MSLQRNMTEVNPPGSVAYFANTTAPSGWLKCNGAAVSRTTYAGLFSQIGTTYGAGDGSTTFNLPELRGEFLRYWADGRSVDTGRTFATSQTDATQRMVGGFGDDHSASVVTYASSGFTNPFAAISSTSWRSNIEAVSGSLIVELDNSRAVRTATENRPRNIALLACIKF
jgi:phage-related tail fiber protein